MSKRLIFVAIGILTIASLAFVIAEIPTVSFIDPTPTTNQTGNSIYVNLSTTSSLEHYSFVDFDNDLVFWMRMDDYSGNIVYDNSSYGNNGTLVNGSYITTGYYKNATGFDGYNDEIRVSDNSALNSISTTDRITVCVWINQTGIMTGKYAGVVGQYGNEASENGGNNRGYLLAKSSTDYKYEFMISQNGASREGVTSSSTFNLNQWYHICGVYNGTNYLLYVNGALDNSAASTYTSIYDSTSYLGIGNYGYRGVGYENGPVYNGSIDEVLIFNRALSLNEIRAIYNSSAYRFEKNYTSLANGGHTFTGYAINSEGNFSSVSRTIYTGVNGSAGDTTPPNVQFVSPTPSTNVSGNSIYVNLSTSDESEHYSFVDFDNDLVFWMRMDDLNSSGQPLDLSYYGNNGSLNDVVINSSSGYFGNGSYFNDAGFIDVPDSDSLDIVGLSDQITVCSWFKIKQHGTDYTGIVARYNTLSGNPDRQFLIGKNNTDNRYGFFLSYSGTTFNAVVLTNTELSTEIWYHLCGTSNGTVSLYLNGVQQTSTTTITGIKDTVNSSLYIGKFGRANSEFNGNIDEVLIFNRALSLNEIRAIYNSSAYRFEKNYTSLANGGHTFTGYAVDDYGNFNSTSRTITSGNASSENTTLQLTLNSPTIQENTFAVWISTNAAASMCWFTYNGGITNTTMFENSSTTFYYEDFNYGNYSITFYCQNANGTGTLTDNFQFKRSYVISDHYYTNSQGLKIYFDFGFNYSAEKGPLVIIPDSWTAVKDASWVTDAENYYISRGYTAAPIDTRGKGSSEGTKDAFGWECLDIYELVQHLISTSPYNSYINSSSIYIAGASGAGGKAGVCTGKYPDTFSAGYSSVGVLNLTLWWQTAGAADVAEIVARVGCNPNQCPEAYLARDASYLGYNTQSAMKAKSNADDDRVTVNCSRNYNISLINYGKTINYTENPTGGHTADFTHSSEWFIAHSNLVFIPISGDLRIGGYVHTKNFSIYLNEIKVNHTAFVDYNISGNSRIFNITTLGFNGTAEINIFDLESSTNYSINENDSLRYLLSDSNGDIEFNVTLSNYTSEIINVSKVVASSPPYCGDGSCNNGETCSSCSADCGSCGGSGGGGGGGGAHRKTNVTANITQPKIENAGVYFESIPSMIVNPGENKKIVLNIRNIGEIFLNSCKLKGTGERASWVSSDAVKDLSPGQNSEFTFNLAVPQNIKAGKYEIGLSLECQELKQSTTINAEVIEKKLGLELLKAERKDNNLIASYSLSELAGQRQEVNVEIILIGEDGKRLASLSEKKAIAPGSRNKFESAIDISKISAGSFYIVINANSEIASASLKEEVVLNKGKISGFVSLTGEEVSNIAITALVIAFAVFAFFAVRRIVKLSGIHKRKNVISAIIAGIRYYDAPDLNAPHHQHAPHQN